MPDKHIGSYLNHHLSASVAWLEAVQRVEDAEKGTPTARALSELRAEGLADQLMLREFMAQLKVSERETEKATAWLSEKLSRLMLPLKDPKEGSYNLLLILEALSLGLEGRRALWVALAAAARESVALQGPDYQILVRRAEEQRARMEQLRLETAKNALRPVQ